MPAAAGAPAQPSTGRGAGTVTARRERQRTVCCSLPPASVRGLGGSAQGTQALSMCMQKGVAQSWQNSVSLV